MILALDPGPLETGWALINELSLKPCFFGKDGNRGLILKVLELMKPHAPAAVVIEKPVCRRHSGASISDTAVQAGIFVGELTGIDAYLITRSKVLGIMCHRGNDKKVKDALVDRFSKGVRNHGKGVASAPGFFYGFHDDIWQAFALGVVFLDMYNSKLKKDIIYLGECKI